MARKKQTTGTRILGLGAGDQRSRSSLPKSFLPPAPSPQPLAPHSAFTLTELLVVITIIAILASLITAAAVNALNASKRARISLEINQLGQSMEEFKNRYGAYPPNGMNTLNKTTQNFNGKNIYPIVMADVQRTFKKAFPRHKEPQGVIDALAGSIDALPGVVDASQFPNGLNSAEAIYFWLGGFSEDPEYPISGPGGPSFVDGPDANTSLEATDEILEDRNRIYEFDLGRLGPRDPSTELFVGRFLTYNDPKTSQLRRINFWTYNPAGSERPYLYFDASRHDPVDYDLDMTGVTGLNIFALKKLREGFSASVTPIPRDIVFVNNKKFQIIHAGLDDAWGDQFAAGNILTSNSATDASNLLLFPAGPFTGDVADTLTNFTPGTLESAQE